MTTAFAADSVFWSSARYILIMNVLSKVLICSTVIPIVNVAKLPLNYFHVVAGTEPTGYFFLFGLSVGWYTCTLTRARLISREFLRRCESFSRGQNRDQKWKLLVPIATKWGRTPLMLLCDLTLFYPGASLPLLCNFAPGVKQHLRGRGEVYNYWNKMLALDFPCRSWAMTYFCFMVTAPGEPRGGFFPPVAE